MPTSKVGDAVVRRHYRYSQLSPLALAREKAHHIIPRPHKAAVLSPYVAINGPDRLLSLPLKEEYAQCDQPVLLVI